ncbi:MAG TPA: DUF763 domain-containing protein [Chitinophagaceae bacterium]|jgi:hypothetical protein|nr:DUF763 domain-containing protein [Chitinophagaceae bacterium]
MKRSGAADLPLHYGAVPPWLAERMAKLGLAITESILTEYGHAEMIRRLSDPFWFQCLGAVMGMDWHSSGITTSVMGALKKAIQPHSHSFGLYIAGGKGKHSRRTPEELINIGYRTGLDGQLLASSSRMSAKVDNTAVQDGFQLYVHNFIVDSKGHWAVIQQGMNPGSKLARRYHWHSEQLSSFTEMPHSAVCGINQGLILNLTDVHAAETKEKIVQLTKEDPVKLLRGIRHLRLPVHHDVREKDVDLKRLGAILWLAQEQSVSDFDGLLALKGLGPRTLQSLTLVSEVIHGTPSRFSDPARFAFAHGGKDGHPFPVPVRVYDETIDILQKSIRQARLGDPDKAKAVKNLYDFAARAEKDFLPNEKFDALIEKERTESWKYGGRNVFGLAQPPKQRAKGVQLKLF